MMILRNFGWIMLDAVVAFGIALPFRFRERRTFRDWWKDEGMMIWLVAAGTILVPLLAFFRFE
jgi:hypothetical protein